jgi:HEAT repeat protein
VCTAGSRPFPTAWHTFPALALATALLAACNNQQPTMTPNVPRSTEQLALYNRSLNLLLRAAESDMDVVSCNAIEALLEVAPEDGLPAFRDAPDAESPLVRYAGYVALGVTRDTASLDRIKAGIRDDHPNVRVAAAFAACRCGEEGYVRILMNALNDSPRESERAEAAALLGRLGDPRAIPWLRAALRQPRNARSNRVALAINGALARLGDAAGLRQLIIYSRGDTASRTEALLILADLDHQDAHDDLVYAMIGPEKEYLEPRLIAARGLAKLGYDDGYQLASEYVQFTDPNPDPGPENPDRTFAVRSLAVHALGEIGDPRALPTLQDIAADQRDPRLQVAAAYAICKTINQRRSLP